MAFVRLKTIKGREYYYLVKSIRKDGKVNQKTLKYLGAKMPPQKKIRELKKKYEKGRR